MEIEFSSEEIQGEPKLLNKITKLGKRTLLNKNKKLLEEKNNITNEQNIKLQNDIINEEMIIIENEAGNLTNNKKDNSSTFLLKLILKAFYLSTWKRKIKSMKYFSRGYNPQRIKFKKLINSISSVIMQHKYEYFNKICENMDRFSMPKNIKHDKNYGTLRIVNKGILSEKYSTKIAEWAENIYDKTINGFKLYLLEAFKKMNEYKELYGQINENRETDYSNYEKYTPSLPKNDKIKEYTDESNKENSNINSRKDMINKEKKYRKEEYFNDYSNDISKSQSDLQTKYNNKQNINQYYNQDINNYDINGRPENTDYEYIEEINYDDENNINNEDDNNLPNNNYIQQNKNYINNNTNDYYDENNNEDFNYIEENKYLNNDNYINQNNYFENHNYLDNKNEIKENDYNNNDYIDSEYNDNYNYEDNEEKENDYNNDDFKENEYEEIYENRNEGNNNYPQIIYQDIDYPQEDYPEDTYEYNNKNYEIEEVYNNNIYEDPKYSNYYNYKYIDNYNNYSHEGYDIDYIDENDNNMNNNIQYTEEENYYYEEPNQEFEKKEITYYLPYNAQKQSGFKYITHEGNNILVSDVYTKPQIQNNKSQIKIYNFDNSGLNNRTNNYEKAYNIKNQNIIYSEYKRSPRKFPIRYDNHSFYISK